MRRFVRFAVVGAGNTLLSAAVYAVLSALGADRLVAAPVAFAAGALNGYVFNRSWTFASRNASPTRYLFVQLAGLGATDALLTLLGGVGAAPSYALAACVVLPITFAANRRFVF